MLKLALVGKNIAHSKSQAMYEKILSKNVDYTLLDYGSSFEIPFVKDLLDEFQGISITSPYKEHFLNELVVEKDVADLFAINCLRQKEGVVSATNTDFLAMTEIIKDLKKEDYRKFILLGNGAMSRVCLKAIKNLGMDHLSFNRKEYGDISDLDLTEHGNVVVLNTCAREYVFNGKISKDSFFYDLNYGHEPHIKYFNDNKLKYRDGLELLELQARYALEFWGL